MTAEKITTFQDLFDFYYREYKPLYCDVTASNRLSQESLLELAAAFDHVARHFVYDSHNEAECAGKAMSHMKRACLDMFKLEYADAKTVYDDLCKLPINLIDNGDFEKTLRVLFAETKKAAKEARSLEGLKAVDSPTPAFDKWKQAYANCKRITSDEFQKSSKVDWAKRKRSRANAISIVVSIICAVWAILAHLGVIPPSP